MKCVHKGSDEGPTIIWTSTAASRSMAVLGGDRWPEIHAFKRFEMIICPWKFVMKSVKPVFKLTPIHDAHV